MAIEFSCPYCTVAVRVPDSAAGKMGRCPKCSTRLLVPNPTRQSTEAPSPIPPAAESVAEPEPSPPEPTPESGGVDGLGQFPVMNAARPVPIASVASRVRRRQRKNRLVWIVPVVALLAFASVVIWWTSPFAARLPLRGELTATPLPSGELFSTEIPASRFGEEEATKTLLDKLTAEPLSLRSGLMRVEFRGGPKGMTVFVEAGTAARLFRVDLSREVAIQRYVETHRAKLEQARARVETAAANDFREAVLNGDETTRDLSRFRDRLGLTALQGGFGHHVMAAVDSTLFPCVYQDTERSLVFVLPVGTTQFRIVGLPTNDPGSMAIDIEYDVTVVEPEATTPQATEETAPKTPSPTEPESKDGEVPATPDAAPANPSEPSPTGT
ncbi:MAG: hypothetical protein KF777_17150 [Planctomycetaceae bacterium]|nr:hypothetical protein [Planctomycetaceae bacterium]